MLVVHGLWCIMFIFIEVEASEAGFEMAVFFPFKGSKGWRFKVFILWESFWVPEIHGGKLRYFFRMGGVQALVARTCAAR